MRLVVTMGISLREIREHWSLWDMISAVKYSNAVADSREIQAERARIDAEAKRWPR